jgi:hypothetical protein
LNTPGFVFAYRAWPTVYDGLFLVPLGPRSGRPRY